VCRAQGGCLALLLVAALAAFPVGGRARQGPDAANLSQVLEQVRRSTRLIEGRTRVRQLYRVEVLGLAWEFSAWVTKENGTVTVQAEGAPWFLPGTLRLAAVEAFQLLEGYEPSLAGTLRLDDGREVWLVEAVPRDPTQGARRVRFWVERDTGQVTHLELEYGWGLLVIDQTYQQVGPYTVLDTQHVQVRPLGIRVEVRYRDYELESLPAHPAS